MNITRNISAWTWLASLVAAACVSAPAAHAAAPEPALLCKANPCAYQVRGDGLEMKLKTFGFECKAVTGQGEYGTAWESDLKLKFWGCSLELEGMRISCTTARRGQLIESRPILAHNAFLSAEPGQARNAPGIFGSLYITFTCGGMLPFRVEGIVNATFRAPGCGQSARRYGVLVAIYAHGGLRRSKQGAEQFYDLSFNDNSERVSVAKTRVGVWQMVFERDAVVAC